RATAYAEGARQGAPTATQVADRFHLVQNLQEALGQVFLAHSQALDAVNALGHQQAVPLPHGALAVPMPPHDLPLPGAAARRAAPGTPAGAAYIGLGFAPPGLDGPGDCAAGRAESAHGTARSPDCHLCGAQTPQ